MRYLILTYYKKPDGKLDECMQVAKKLKTKDIQTASVILDFKKLEVVKASVGESTVSSDFNCIVEYYMQYYDNIIKRLFYENGYQFELSDNKSGLIEK